MARRSKFAHLKPDVVAAFEAGRSLDEVLEEWPDLPRSTAQRWRQVAINSGNSDKIRATPINTGVKDDPLPPGASALVPINGGQPHIIRTPKLRQVWGRLEHLLHHPGDGKEAIATAQLANAMVRVLETDQRLAEAPAANPTSGWTERDQAIYDGWENLTEEERQQHLSEALMG